MKKLIFILLASFSLVSVAQEELKEGVISSKMTMSSDNAEMNSQLQMMGETKITTYFKEDKVRAETSSPMSGENITIIDKSKEKVLTLLNSPMYGKKYSMTEYEEPKELGDDIKITKGDQTKTILGYDCQQYNVTMKAEGVDMTMEIFATDQIKAQTQETSQFGDKLDGFPLYMKINVLQQGMKMTMLYDVTDVKSEAVSNEMFDLTVPEGYSKMGDQ
ncbi:MAG: DUF4412 domain-containing protein [Flavobacteriaceae bacterium]|nr:DUF4412 domain-containing protein [Flavobacteriaceae bacterium]